MTTMLNLGGLSCIGDFRVFCRDPALLVFCPGYSMQQIPSKPDENYVVRGKI